MPFDYQQYLIIEKMIDNDYPFAENMPGTRIAKVRTIVRPGDGVDAVAYDYAVAWKRTADRVVFEDRPWVFTPVHLAPTDSGYVVRFGSSTYDLTFDEASAAVDESIAVWAS